MPDNDQTEALKPTLTPYFGREVTQAKIEIRNVGGGLQEALKFDPVELDHGEERWVALKVHVAALRFDEVKDSECLARVHIMRPVDDQISFLDDDPKLVGLVEKHIDGRVEKIRIAREREAGILTLLDGGGEGGEGEGEGEPFGHLPGERPDEADGSASGDDSTDDPTAPPGDVEDDGWEDE